MLVLFHDTAIALSVYVNNMADMNLGIAGVHQ
jgi:hypothetical protein